VAETVLVIAALAVTALGTAAFAVLVR